MLLLHLPVVLRWQLSLPHPYIGTLAAKLAREAYSSEDVLAKYTVSGDRGLPGLPIVELQLLKRTLFAQFSEYWRSPHEFEPLWSTATTSISQLCKRPHGNSSQCLQAVLLSFSINSPLFQSIYKELHVHVHV